MAPAPAAPPTTPGRITHSRNRGVVWPTGFGIALIIFNAVAALGALSQVISGIVAPMMQAFQQSVMSQSGAPVPLMPDAALYSGISAALNAVMLLIAVLGIVAGAMLAARKTIGVRLTRVWAWTRILAFIIYPIAMGTIQLLMTQQMVDGVSAAAAQSGGGAPPPGAMDAFAVGMTIAVFATFGVMAVVWGWVLPIVVLVKLSRPASKQEIGRWSARQGEPARAAS